MGTRAWRIWLWAVVLALSGPPADAGEPSSDPKDQERPAGWSGEVQANLGEAEYRFAPGTNRAAEVWSAPNRAHGFRIRVDRAGLSVASRTEPISTWELRLVLVGFGRGTTLHSVDEGALETWDNQVSLRRSGIVERYSNRRTGLKQTFELEAPPRVAPDEGPAVLALVLAGSVSPRIGVDRQSIDFLAPEGHAVVRYAGLEVRDALGRRLSSWMEGLLHLGGRQIRLLFDDRGAVYPVTVDPLLTTPAWTAGPDQEGAAFGWSAETAGDVNGDGYSDVIVGAFGYDNGADGEGRVFVYHGSASGLATTAAWTAEGDQVGANFGRSVASAGDVNGDGYSDVIVASVYHDNVETDEGRVFVYHGSPTGLAATPSFTAEPDQDHARIVHATTAGDVNGDGYSDVIFGAMLYDNGETNEGRVFVHHGSSSGLGATPVWTIEGDQANAILGARVGSAGDVNGDGYSDVLVAAYFYDAPEENEGRVYVYHGSPTGLATEPAWTGESDQPFGEFGDRLAAGDLDGDGYTDIIVGAHEYDNGEVDEGIFYVFHGSPSGVETTPRWIGEGNQEGAFYAGSLGSADINGDGYADLLVGANFYDNGEEDEGRAYLYLGSATGVRRTPAWTAESDQEGANFGMSVASAGDVNGDGFTDVIVGAPLYDDPEYNEGRVFVFNGSAAGLAQDEVWTTEGDQPGATLGFSVRVAGDVNGDGFSDVIVGAPLYDHGEADEGRAFVFHGSAAGLETSPAWMAESDQLGAQLAYAVDGAGDVNGDGYSDVIVGAVSYDNGETDEGRVFVYHGSVSGLPASPAWTAEGDQSQAWLGYAVGTAGDVDGDGYSDVVVGAPLYDNGQSDEGRAFVYHGSTTGLQASPAWVAESDQSNAWLGSALGTAGDVDGDGYSDVIVGAALYDNGQSDEGRVFVYHGTAAGLETSPGWTVVGQQAMAWFGHSVATAGDVNGDGYSDVIVGAPLYDNGQTDEGRAYVFHGSAAGLKINGRVLERNQAATGFGGSVATAGDVNGDGFSDLIVGAPGYDNGGNDAGAVFVYHGTALGPSPSPAWTVLGEQASAALGTSVAGAGDFDGDGLADVVVAAPQQDGGQTEAGRISVYSGNGGGGLDLIPRQARVDSETPIDLLGRSDSETSFRLMARGRSAAGRGRVRLEWEVKPLGTPFDGLGLGEGPSIDSGEPSRSGSAVELGSLVAGLTPGPYHWRLRVATDSPFFPHSPWLSLPFNNRTETDVRVSCPTSVLAEIAGLGLSDDKETLVWAASGSAGVEYDVVRGLTGELPVGGGVSEICLATGLRETSLLDQAVPPTAQSYWYLVRGRNVCGAGSYGAGSDGADRQTAVCP